MKMAFDPRTMYPRVSEGKEKNAGPDSPDNLKKVCQDFEAILINSLFQEMRKTVPDDGFFEQDMGMDLFQEIMDAEIAREMARKGGLGLGKALYEQLSRGPDRK